MKAAMSQRPDPYPIPLSRLVATEATPPGSKSITNRVLLLAALANGESTLTGALDAEDARVMLDALNALGVEATLDSKTRVAKIRGVDGNFPRKGAQIFVGNSGTTARFLTAALAFAEEGDYRIDGKPRMQERPFGDLLDALKTLDRDVVSERGTACPPLLVRGKSLENASPIVVPIAADVSSQFLSGLLMAAPLAKRDLTFEITGALASRPYVETTLATMRAFGVEVETDAAFRRFSFRAGQSYRAREYAIEPDASAASYFFALPAILGGRMTIRGLSRDSLQGDVAFVECLEKMGCVAAWASDSITVERAKRPDGTLTPLRGIDVDLNAHSDVAQTLAVVALFADSPTSIRNVANMRVKETDRIAALTYELRKLGARVEERPDGLTVDPRGVELKGTTIKTYDDHRMAMSFALAGLRVPGVAIENPNCVAKTYPEFFEDLAKATAPI